MLATKAFHAQRAPGADQAKQAEINTWRHAQVFHATDGAAAGLTACTQDHYGTVKARLLHLLARDGEALKADLHGRPEVNDRRVVTWKIIRRCQEYGISIAKADGICRRMTHGRSLDEVQEPRTLWNIFFKLDYYKPSTRN